ncbi:PLD nuclease N-terminal domain-containing protein [Phaeobacter sp. C3_T13_0]|uniref:PLD nuclease N-terminal domain-containing protein n=1 Tax=Phaeobacter cretensis TaxID=3342641 RepID=UPI0039BC67C8
MGYSLLGLLILIAGLYAIYQILTSGASTGAKVIWALVIIFLPVVGLIAWIIAGPRGGR